MSRSIAQIKEQTAIAYFPTLPSAPLSKLLDGGKTGFSIQSKPQPTLIHSPTGLLSQIDCYFPRGLSVSASAAFDYAAAINQQLVHSKAFVVQDIDGDGGYYLRVDTLLEGCYEAKDYDPKAIDTLLASMSQDLERLNRFFRDLIPAPHRPSPLLKTTLPKPTAADQLA